VKFTFVWMEDLELTTATVNQKGLESSRHEESHMPFNFEKAENGGFYGKGELISQYIQLLLISALPSL